jgi:hypothetical protein
MSFDQILEEAFEAVRKGTLFRVMVKGKLPKGFPRGELLCCPAEGVRTYLICPVKVINHIYQQRKL